jgi:DNA end-binding protein Ku
MAYTLRFPYELRHQNDYFRDIKPAAINADSLELAETLIKKMSAKLDLSKFEDGYEVAVKALVEAKINNLPVPIDEAPGKQPTNVVNLMDALRKSISPDTRVVGKKPPKSEKEPPAKKIALVKSTARRKSA